MSDPLALDLETSTLRPDEPGACILAVGLSAALGTTAGPVDHPDDLRRLEAILRSSRPLAVHDVRMEGTWSEGLYGIRLSGDRVTDTKLLANRLHPGQPANLAALVSKYCPEISGYKADTDGLIKAGKILEVPKEDLLRRVAVDAWATRQLVDKMLPQIDGAAQPWLAEDVDLALCVERIAQRGLVFDEEEALRIKDEAAATQDRLTEKYEGLNLGSPQQVGQLLEALGVSLPASAGGGKETGEAVLRAALDSGEGREGTAEVIGDVLAYRGAGKLRGTYVEGYARRRSADGRLRSDLWWPGTVSWRLASSDPNLQNVPAGVRSVFRADRGWVLVEADYAQAELRIGAAVAPEPVLVDIFRAGGDPHAMLTERIFGPGFTKDQRHHAKTTNFSLMYDGTENTLRKKFMEQGISLTWQQANKYVRGFHTTYRGFDAWTQATREKLLAGEPVFSPTAGYRWTLEDALALTNGDQEDALKAVKNWTIQCVPPRWTLRAALRAEREGIRVVLQTHDGLIAEVPETDLGQARRLGQIMAEVSSEEGFMRGVAVPADLKVGPTWGNMSPLKE